jgi:hypothetical protein
MAPDGTGQSQSWLVPFWCSRVTLMIVDRHGPQAFVDTSSYTSQWSVAYYPADAVLHNGQTVIDLSSYGVLAAFGQPGLRRIGDDASALFEHSGYDSWAVSSAGQPAAIADAYAYEYPYNISLRDYFQFGQAVTAVIDLPGGLRLTQVTSPSGDPHLFTMQVVVSNPTGQWRNAVRYRRAINFDPGPCRGDYQCGYGTFGKIGGDTSYLAGDSNDDVPDPTGPLTYSNADLGWFVDAGPYAALDVDINLGDIGPGQSRMFSLFFGETTDKASAIAAATAVGAQGYGLAQRATDQGPATQYTGVFAIDGSDLT